MFSIKTPFQANYCLYKRNFYPGHYTHLPLCLECYRGNEQHTKENYLDGFSITRSSPTQYPQECISKNLKFGIENILEMEKEPSTLYKDKEFQSSPQRNALCKTVICHGSSNRRPWSRPVFSQLQRRSLENRFQIQKYITRLDRCHLAARLGLSERQVKVWFQNRRTKWRQDMKDTDNTLQDPSRKA